MSENRQHPDGQEFGVPVGHSDYGNVTPETAGTELVDSVPDSTGLRLMAVHAHPDDESSKGAAMMAAYQEAGAEVMVVLCTGGEEGSLLNEHYGDAVRVHRDIAGVRHQEMAAAGAALGVEHRWLGYLDSGFPDDPKNELEPGVFAEVDIEYPTAALVRTIREFRPHVIISYDEIGGYPHPDHLRAHEVTVRAYEDAADPEKFPQAGAPWEISKLYYDRAFNPDKYRALNQAFLDSGRESPYADRIAWYERLESGDEPDAWRITPHQVTTQIPVAKYLSHRDNALRAHATQVDPTGMFFAVDHEMMASTWPWDDYVLIDSRVKTHLPETDLFSGLRDGSEPVE